MLNPTDYTFDVGIYTDLSLQQVDDLVYEKLREYDPNGDGPLWEEYNVLQTKHFFTSNETSWEAAVGIREQIISKAVEIVNIVDGPKSASPNIEQVTELETIEPVNVTSIETPPIDDGLPLPEDITAFNNEIEVDPNENTPVLTPETPIDDTIEQPRS